MPAQADGSLLALTDAFHAAALGDGSWDTALQGLADATGSRSAQLTVVHSDASVAFNVMTNMDPSALTLFPETAAINPRVAAAHNIPLLQATVDWDFMTPEAFRQDQFCQEVARPLDAPFICMTILDRNEQTFVALAVIRSHREGTILEEQKQLFTAVAPHVRTAVRTHTALEGRGFAMLTDAMQTLWTAAFVCDQNGKVVMLTPAAEALLRNGSGLELKAGRLDASEPVDARVLNDAIVAAAACLERRSPRFCRTVIIQSRANATTPVVLDVLTLPARPFALHLSSPAPRVLVVARGSRGAGVGRAAILASAYGLTSAESEIALLLAEGQAAEAIARSRGVAVGTVRAQTKTILGKVGVRRQIELAARLNQL